MFSIVNLPGYGGSGPSHWQSLWEREDRSITRFQPADWEKPELRDWVAAAQQAIEAAPHPVMLVAHSLACLVVPHLSRTVTRRLAGAVLVAVPDPGGPDFPRAARMGGFAAVAASPLEFPALMIASSNDPYASASYAERRSRDWRVSTIMLGDLGHINSDSGLGAWPEGRRLVAAFCAGLRKADRT